MDTEFHYYITGMIARSAGFSEEEAGTIAYASQYVDDNQRYLAIRDPSTGEVFRNHISQTTNVMKKPKEFLRIWPVFHFVPGDPSVPSARRKDEQIHVMNTTPDGPRARDMLSQSLNALESNRLHKIGVATHAYVDTWSHQNFVGTKDVFNNISALLIPDIGHADALHNPDLIRKKWTDVRLVEKKIDNNTRFMSAAKGLYEMYHVHLQRRATASWSRLSNMLTTIMALPKNDRSKKFKELKWLPKYDKRNWLDDAAEDRVEALAKTKGLYKWKRRKEATDWHKFQRAVIEHENRCVFLLSKLYKKTRVKQLKPLFEA